jgi:hypothetical protein
MEEGELAFVFRDLAETTTTFSGTTSIMFKSSFDGPDLVVTGLTAAFERISAILSMAYFLVHRRPFSRRIMLTELS